MTQNTIPNQQKADFRVDLARGRIGELCFLHACGNTVLPLDGRKADFQVKKTGELLELKTDSYNYFKTPNVFIERYSSGFKDGGPFQSKNNKVQYFAYMFEDPGFLFIYDVKKLCRRIKLLARKKQISLVTVPNKGYNTRGYKVKRALLKDLEIDPKNISITFDSAGYQWFKTFNRATP